MNDDLYESLTRRWQVDNARLREAINTEFFRSADDQDAMEAYNTAVREYDKSELIAKAYGASDEKFNERLWQSFYPARRIKEDA